MQLVLSNNRVVAHGENFLAMGGVVINTETGAKFENATVAECDNCPSDINEVGYEYHAGVFKPCAPYGMGNQKGYVMEVCPDCATPRNSGVLIADIKWSKISSVVCVGESRGCAGVSETFSFPIDKNDIAEYSMLRYKIRGGSFINFGCLPYATNVSAGEVIPILTVDGVTLMKWSVPYKSGTSKKVYEYDRDIPFVDDLILPFNVIVGNGCYSMSTNASGGATNIERSCSLYMPTGDEIDITSIALNMPWAAYSTDDANHYNNANIVIELEGRR